MTKCDPHEHRNRHDQTAPVIFKQIFADKINKQRQQNHGQGTRKISLHKKSVQVIGHKKPQSPHKRSQYKTVLADADIKPYQCAKIKD